MRFQLRLLRSAVGVLVVILVAACSPFGSDATPEPTSAPPTATALATAMPIPTMAPTEPAATAASEPMPSPTTAPSPTASPTLAPSPTATAIPTRPLGELRQVDPQAIPNYTLRGDVALTGVTNEPDFTSQLTVFQADHDHYYVKVQSSEGQLESWYLEGTLQVTQADGSVTVVPDAADAMLFSPTFVLQSVPQLSPTTPVQVGATEEINGVVTRHFRILAADAIAANPWLNSTGATNPTGTIDLWVDQLNLVTIRETADISWTNADGSRGAYNVTWNLSDIGATPRLQGP